MDVEVSLGVIILHLHRCVVVACGHLRRSGLTARALRRRLVRTVARYGHKIIEMSASIYGFKREYKFPGQDLFLHIYEDPFW